MYGEINRDVPAIPSLPGLGGSHFDDSIKAFNKYKIFLNYIYFLRIRSVLKKL